MLLLLVLLPVLVLVPLLPVLPLLLLPPHGPLQTPDVLPTASSHVSPGQQSALVLHAPQAGTHVPEPW